MKLTLRQLLRLFMPQALRARVRAVQQSRQRIAQGAGAGLFFDAGPGNYAYVTGANELPVQACLQQYLRPDGVLYDIGANVGFFTVIGARLVGPAGAIYAFEPVQTNAGYIERNAARNGFGNVTVFRKAVSYRTGSDRLYLAEYAGGAALESAGRPPDARELVTVEVSSIDDLYLGGDLRTPTAVKIDVEGAELDVLRGMRETLTRATPIIILELDDASRDALARKQAGCEAFLSGLGYGIQLIEASYPNERWFVTHLLALHRSRHASRGLPPVFTNCRVSGRL